MTTVTECNDVLRTLERRREALVARGALLPQLRRDAAYDAHAKDDAASRRVLDEVSQELATHESELASLDDAISTAKVRVIAVQALEDTAAKRAGAKEAVELIAKFKEAGHVMDQALRQITEQGATLNDLLSQLHRTTGGNFPSRDQLDTLGYAAVMTALLRSPWAKRFRPMQPSQRREFGPLFEGWCAVLESRIRPLLEDDDEAA